MRCAALTGIAPEVIKDIKAGRPRTIELQSTHNIVTIATVEPDPESHIFMTSIDLADLGPGDAGICVHVLASSISMKRLVEFSHGKYYEERERMSARFDEAVRLACAGGALATRGLGARTSLPTAPEVERLAAGSTAGD